MKSWFLIPGRPQEALFEKAVRRRERSGAAELWVANSKAIRKNILIFYISIISTRAEAWLSHFVEGHSRRGRIT